MGPNAELTGRRSAQRGGYPTATPLDGPVERRVGPHDSKMNTCVHVIAVYGVRETTLEYLVVQVIHLPIDS